MLRAAAELVWQRFRPGLLADLIRVNHDMAHDLPRVGQGENPRGHSLPVGREAAPVQLVALQSANGGRRGAAASRRVADAQDAPCLRDFGGKERQKLGDVHLVSADGISQVNEFFLSNRRP